MGEMLIEADVDFSDGFPSEIQALLQLLPTEFSGFFVPQPVRQPVRQPVQPAVTPSHPCDREIDMCVSETGSNERSTLEVCLTSHLDELSPSCKCFLHKVLGETAPAATAAPPVLAVEVEEVVVHTHHSMCMFMAPVFFVITFLLMRRTFKMCFKPREQLVAVVAVPEDTMVATIEPLVAPKPDAKLEVVPAYQVTA
jgi:hypothetical protein